MVAGNSIRLVVVTPEKTLLDETVSSLRFPLYDGDIGIFPGRLPLIGRLGTGELHIKIGEVETRYFIDGGFVQVRGGVVTLLTDRAVPVEQLSEAAAEKELDAARQQVAKSELDLDRKEAALRRARKQLSIARKAH
jgi:F-type H+-transporting ATPase subunit epsilon